MCIKAVGHDPWCDKYTHHATIRPQPHTHGPLAHPQAPSRQQRSGQPSYDRRRILSTLGMLSSVLGQVQPFSLRSDLHFRQDLRSYRSSVGDLQTSNLNTHDLTILQRQLRSSGQLFQDLTQHSPHVFTCIVDSGCSFSATNTFTDVEPSSIRKLREPINLGGIAGGLSIEYIGKANWETLNDAGDVVSFHEDVLIHPALPDRLLSPQAFLRGRKGQEHFRVFHDRAEWHRDGSRLLTMEYDSSFLPRLILFSKGESISTLKSFTSVLHSSNSNLTALQKIWLRWHYKLGHLSFSHVQSLAIGGLLDTLALGLRHSKTTTHPLCTACQYGKQVRRPDHTTITQVRPDHNRVASLSTNSSLETASSVITSSPVFQVISFTLQVGNLIARSSVVP